jgi:Ca-activated chloride channel family protein
MSWSRPELLALLAALAVLMVLRWAWIRRVRRQRAAVGAGVPHLSASVGRRREALRSTLLTAGLALALVALAGPRWGASEERRSASGADVLLVLDCSRSMLASDFYPNRLEAARRKAGDLFRLAPETRLALMPFAALPVLRCPLTGDHHAIEQMLRDCTPELFPADAGYQGTAIGDAVQSGITLLGRQVERGQAVLVMSDGADDDHAAVTAAGKAAKAAGVPVYGLFFGDSERKVTVRIDGKDEVMNADRSTLAELAETTGGICVDARQDDADMRLIHEHIQGNVAQTPWEERHRVVQSERFQLALLPAIALLALGALLGTRRRT